VDVKTPQLGSWRKLARHVLRLRQDEAGWALVTREDEILYRAEGPYARRRLLLVARDLDALTVR
jgi:hypothetical protein